jgi:sodium/pantothenate symporter
MMAGIMAAGLSSASTFLSVTAFSVSNDIFTRANEPDSERLHDSRIAMLVVSVIALALAWFTPQGYLYWIVYFVGTLFASSWGPVAFMSVWNSRITEGGAFWGIIAGLAGNIGANLLKVTGLVELPTVLDPILLGALASYITIEIVSRTGTVSDREHELRERLHHTPESEYDSAKLHRTLLYSKAVAVFGVLLAALLVIFYVLPYQQALNESAMNLVKGVSG